MVKKKPYVHPTAMVIILRQESLLTAVSGRDDYIDGGDILQNEQESLELPASPTIESLFPFDTKFNL